MDQIMTIEHTRSAGWVPNAGAKTEAGAGIIR